LKFINPTQLNPPTDMVPPLRKVKECVWEIPKTYKPCMRVSALIFANEALLEKMKADLTLEQAANVACLPGIYKYSITLPDGHQGYGFPIGGVAAIDADEGVISPGGIGYDINCLPKGTRILTKYGYAIPIEKIKLGDELTIIDEVGKFRKVSNVVALLGRKSEKLIRITTRAGYEIRVTEDHPILTKNGMVEAKNIGIGALVAIYPFEGVEYEEPEEFVILSGEEFSENIKKELRKRNLIPLTSRNSKLPIILKLLGYALGDGTLYKKFIVFYGRREDLEEILEDIKKLGYSGRMYCRERAHKVKNYEFKTRECYLRVASKSLVELFKALGYPVGNKTKAKYSIPRWLFKLPLWMKRLFLAALFGAELSKPKTMNGYNFYMPELKVSKVKELERSAIEYLEDIKKLLEEFDITSTISKVYEENGKVIYRLLIHENSENLIKLWSKINYEYNRERRKLANAAVIYLRLKEKLKYIRKIIRSTCKSIDGKKSVLLASKIALNGGVINERFIERSLYENVENARIPKNFITFEEFVKNYVYGEVVYDYVEDVDIEEYNDVVYDLTVNDDSHNFIANNFIVHNCGVRLLVTNLTERDVRPRLRELVDTIFKLVPAGVGETGLLRLSFSELDKVLDDGVTWAINQGYGWVEDQEYIEEKGSWEIADSSAVSQRAKERGKDQLGTVGSGNHFIEIQKVDKIYDPEIAKVFGIEHEGQVTVMIHTGSRGLGHQVATDYLRIFERGMRQWGLRLPDRELAAAPLHSREGQNYIKAMAAAANYAWTNRQIITHWVREAFRRVFGKDPDKLGMYLVYDVAHNIAKLEEHDVGEGRIRKVWVHRKGATRAFPAGRPEIPAKYRDVGQPVLIPGSMGTASYVLVGTPESMKITFGTSPHGAGRVMSREAAIRALPPSKVRAELEKKGIIVRSAESEIISEEAPQAYKNVDIVVEVSATVGFVKPIARMVPMGVVKG